MTYYIRVSTQRKEDILKDIIVFYNINKITRKEISKEIEIEYHKNNKIKIILNEEIIIKLGFTLYWSENNHILVFDIRKEEYLFVIKRFVGEDIIKKI